MEETRHSDQPLPMRGLYGHINISVRTLNIIIVTLVLLLVACMVYGISKGGYEVSFESRGGTVVEPQTRMYGELVSEPKPPTREGYIFDGWYLDSETSVLWNMDEDIVKESMTLYAGWIEEIR